MRRAKANTMGFGFYFGLIVYGALWLAVLELNKNRIVGWVLALALLVLYALLYRRVLLESRWFVKLGAFLLLTALLLGTVLLTQGPVRRRPAVEGKDLRVTDVVTVEQGQLTGVCTPDGAVEVYAGIPYAAPPVGALRWREPQDPEPWEGVLAADTFAPMAMQVVNSNLYSSLAQIIGYHDYTVSLHDNFRDAVSEDALYLNIWKPAGAAEKLPVIVYIHGGALQTGQPWYADYSGEGLARKNTVVVNFGYRLGAFGFYADEELIAESPNGTTGNYGLLDQIKALEWVQKNIAAFGGDPENVTIAGESAGSACVSALCVSPLAKGLFRRAIGESSSVTAPAPAHSYRLLDEALRTGAATKARFGASTVEELRAVPAEKLAAAMDVNHHITIDGYVLPKTPYEAYQAGENNEEALLEGFNAYEGTAFILFDMATMKNYESKVRAYFKEYADEVLALYPAETDRQARDNWIDIYSAVLFTYGHYCWTRQEAALGLPVYEYYFTQDNGRLGAWHSGEEVYCWGNIPAGSKLYTAYDRELSEIFSGYFANFAATGDPNGEGLPVWERASDGRTVQELGEQVGPREDPYLALYAILDRMHGWEA